VLPLDEAHARALELATSVCAQLELHRDETEILRDAEHLREAIQFVIDLRASEAAE
jgi:hypothetical protein